MPTSDVTQPTVTDPRDREPPPAPKKPKVGPMVADASPPLLELTGPAPNAPAAERNRVISLYDMPDRVRFLAAKQLVGDWYPEYIGYATSQDEYDYADQLSLECAVKVTPLSLGGELGEKLIAHAGALTFKWDDKEICISPYSYRDGKVAVIEVLLDKVQLFPNQYVPNQIKYRFAVDDLPPVQGRPDVSKENGHWEFQKIGKGGREWFWVEAKAIN